MGNQFGEAPNYGSSISLVTSEDATAWLTSERQAGLASTTKITIVGYPALEMKGTSLKDDCEVVVDVTDGQYLNIFSSPSIGRGTSPEPFCEEAKRVAGLAMQTLLARQ